MITVKYDIQMPILEEDWLLKYKESWFYYLYKVELKNFFLDLKYIENLDLKEFVIIFNDFVRFMSENLDVKQFKLCHFELNFIINNKDLILSNHFNLEYNPKILYLKYILINGEYESSYQYLDNVKTIKFENVKY